MAPAANSELKSPKYPLSVFTKIKRLYRLVWATCSITPVKPIRSPKTRDSQFNKQMDTPFKARRRLPAPESFSLQFAHGSDSRRIRIRMSKTSTP